MSSTILVIQPTNLNPDVTTIFRNIILRIQNSRNNNNNTNTKETSTTSSLSLFYYLRLKNILFTETSLQALIDYLLLLLSKEEYHNNSKTLFIWKSIEIIYCTFPNNSSNSITFLFKLLGRCTNQLHWIHTINFNIHSFDLLLLPDNNSNNTNNTSTTGTTTTTNTTNTTTNATNNNNNSCYYASSCRIRILNIETYVITKMDTISLANGIRYNTTSLEELVLNIKYLHYFHNDGRHNNNNNNDSNTIIQIDNNKNPLQMIANNGLRLSKSNNLKSIQLNNCYVDTQGIIDLVHSLQYIPTVRHLDLSNITCIIVIYNNNNNNNNTTGMTTTTIRSSMDNILESLASLLTCNGIEQLNLSSFQHRLQQLQVREPQQLQQLEEQLPLQQFIHQEEEEKVGLSSITPIINILQSSPSITTTTTTTTTTSSSLSALRILNLSYNNLHDNDAISIGKMLTYNKTLIELDISNNNITNFGILSLCNQLPFWYTLKKLKLQSNSFTITTTTTTTTTNATNNNNNTNDYDNNNKCNILHLLLNGMKQNYSIEYLDIGVISSLCINQIQRYCYLNRGGRKLLFLNNNNNNDNHNNHCCCCSYFPIALWSLVFERINQLSFNRSSRNDNKNDCIHKIDILYYLFRNEPTLYS